MQTRGQAVLIVGDLNLGTQVRERTARRLPEHQFVAGSLGDVAISAQHTPRFTGLSAEVSVRGRAGSMRETVGGLNV